MDKKKRELKILEETLDLSRKRAGESKRNVDMIRGRISQQEAPDFIVSPTKLRGGTRSILAIEHFRADHFSEANKKTKRQDSLASIERKKAEHILGKWNPKSFHADIPPDILKEVSSSIGRCIGIKLGAAHANFLRSFSEGFEKHLSKVPAYIANAKAIARNGETVECALLIELHSDYSHCFVHNNASCHRAVSGELFLFKEMFDWLKLAAKDIDYILLGSYEGLKDDIADAAVIRPKQLEQSLEKNAIPIYRYFGEDCLRPECKPVEVTPTVIAASGSQIGIDFTRKEEAAATPEQMAIYADCLSNAIDARKNNCPFLTTVSVQALLEIYGDKLEKQPRIGPKDIELAHRALGAKEVDRRMRLFEERWFPSA